MEELIKQYELISEFFDSPNLNIIISANNTVLVEQTKNRMINDLASGDDACIKNSVFSWTSGDKESNISVGELCMDICENKVDMVIVCAHPTRLKYLYLMIERLSMSRLFDRKINIWIDEADRTINLWSKYESVLAMKPVQNVTLVSATFEAVLHKYKSLIVLPYLQTHADCYRGLKHMTIIQDNLVVSSATDYVRHIISEHAKDLIQPGLRAFIPGDTSKSSHNEIADMLKQLGFIVVIINGERKQILLPYENKPIDLTSYFKICDGEVPKEFNSQLALLYKQNNWHKFPLAITGFYCVERGVTFQCPPEDGIHDGFLFDYGIVPPISSSSEAYQLMARLFGNIGNFPHYNPIRIYSSSAMFKKVEKQEQIAFNIARMVAENNIDRVDKYNIRDAERYDFESLFDLFCDEHSSIENANKRLHSLGVRTKNIKSFKTDDNGFLKSSTTKKLDVLSYDDVIKEMSSWSKTSNFDLKKDHSKVNGRIYVCYKNTNDLNSAVFITRVLIPRGKYIVTPQHEENTCQ
jgi:hypothetical protein